MFNIFNLFGTKVETRAAFETKETATVSRTEATIGAIIPQIPEVATCLSIRSNAFASLPVNIYKVASDGYKIEATDHPLWQVFNIQPTEDGLEDMNEILRKLALDYDVNGNAYCQIVRRPNGDIHELLYLPATCMTIVPDDVTRLKYIYSSGAQVLKLDPKQVLHVRCATNNNNYEGQGWVQKARDTITAIKSIDAIISEVNESLVVPSIVLESPNKVGNDQLAQIKDQMEIQKKKKSSPLVLSDGMKRSASTTNTTVENAQTLMAREYRVRQLASQSGVPCYMLGITSDRKPAAMQVQENLEFYNSFLKAMVDAFSAAFNLKLLDRFEKTQYRVEFDISEMSDVAENNRDSFAAGIQNGWLSRAEVRKKLNLPYIKGSEQLLIPTNILSESKQETNK